MHPVSTKHQPPVVRKVDNAIHRINHYSADSVFCFVNTYPMDSDLSGGQRNPVFEQPGPGVLNSLMIRYISATVSHFKVLIGEVKHYVYGRRQTANIKSVILVFLIILKYITQKLMINVFCYSLQIQIVSLFSTES